MLVYNKDIELDKYFGTNLPLNELNEIHTKYDFFILKSGDSLIGETSDFLLYYNRVIFDNFSDVVNKVDENEILIISSVFKRFSGLEITYIILPYKRLLDLNNSQYTGLIRKIKINKIIFNE